MAWKSITCQLGKSRKLDLYEEQKLMRRDASGKQGQDDNAIYGLKNYIIYLICPILIHGLTKVDINPYCLWAGAIIRTPIDLVHV